VERTLAEFPDYKSAVAAVQRLVESSFDKADLELHAVAKGGSSVWVPIVHRSQLFTGFLIGGALSLPIAAAMVASLGIQSSPSLGVLAVGLGSTLGATLGLGWWSVRVDRSSVPASAASFVIAVKGPAERLTKAQSVMQQAGGCDATSRPTAPAPGPAAQ